MLNYTTRQTAQLLLLHLHFVSNWLWQDIDEWQPRINNNIKPANKRYFTRIHGMLCAMECILLCCQFVFEFESIQFSKGQDRQWGCHVVGWMKWGIDSSVLPHSDWHQTMADEEANSRPNNAIPNWSALYIMDRKCSTATTTTTTATLFLCSKSTLRFVVRYSHSSQFTHLPYS